MRLNRCVMVMSGIWCLLGVAEAGDWPQFRGPNASGLAPSDTKLPTQLGPSTNVIWKTAIPAGHSSPVVAGNRVYLTAVRGQVLVTIGLERRTGKQLWEAEAPYQKLEEVHQQVGSRAQSTPASDGRRVVCLFGSAGLFCYDPDGKLLWRRPMGPFHNSFGAGSSPIIVDDWIILNQDHDTDSFLEALDKHTGKTIWKTLRPEFPRGYATPVIWQVAGKRQIVVVGTLRIVGYDFATGKEIWTVHGISRIVNMTPVIGPEGILYVAAWAPGGDDTNRIDVAPFDVTVSKCDANQNGTIEPAEAPNGPIKQRFDQIDLDKSGSIIKAEYEYMRRVFDNARNVVLAIKPGGTGDITNTHVLWSQKKTIPYVPSPIVYSGHLFTVMSGGIVNCLSTKTGEPTKQGRATGSGQYFSSPVAGDGKIYLLSRDGALSVITAEPQWRLLASADFGEEAYATPAIADNRIYLRTNGTLYCFGLE